MAGRETPRIAVIGAGPIGLEAALHARKLQLPVVVFEQGRVGEHLHRWGHVQLFTPFGMNSTPLGRSAIRSDDPQHAFPADGATITGREHVAVYLDPLSRNSLLRGCLRPETQVLGVSRRGFLKEEGVDDSSRGRQPFCLLIRKGKERETVEEAEVVLDCTGVYGRHRWLGDGGLPSVGEIAAEPFIAYRLEDVLGQRQAVYAGKTILVIGAGASAAAAICSLANLAEKQPATWVIWLARRASTQPIKRIANDPFKERDRLAVRANNLASRGDGNVEFHPQSVIEAIDCAGPDKGFRVTARCAGKLCTWEVDRVIGHVGYTPDVGLYRELQVLESSPLQGPKTSEPNFFILGAKSYGRNSNFLMQAGFEQVREVFSWITGKKNS